MLTAQEERAAEKGRWHETVIEVLKQNDVRLITYVPDNVLRPLIDGVSNDPYFKVVPTTREEEAVGIVCGAFMAGMPGVVLMQTSGLATLGNVLASLPSVYNIPALMIISERGVLGEFNRGQAMVARTMRPTLEAAGVDHVTVTRADELAFTVDRFVKQALATLTPGALILSPLLTGGKSPTA